MRNYAITVLVSLMVGAAIGYFAAVKVREHSIKGLEEQVAQQTADLAALRERISADSVKIVEQEGVLTEVRDSAARAVKYWKQKADDALDAADDIIPVADSTETELEALLDPHEYALFQKYVSLRDTETQLLRVVIFAKDGIIFERERTIANQDSLLNLYRKNNADLHKAVQDSEELIEFWKESSKRDWWEMPKFTVPATIITTLGGVYLIGKATEQI
jgi:gas vesicle protein